MKKNIGTIDRVIRLILGIVAGIAVFFISNIYVQVVLSVLAMFTVYEALVGWCLLYALLGRNTCPIDIK